MIPAWNLQGVLPPVRPGAHGHDPDRSPYKSSLHSLIDAMGISCARLNILDGLLKFRAEIHRIGIDTGFQWLNGSFSEHVEVVEARDPRDVDVVTFLDLPNGLDQEALVARNPRLFDQAYVKDTYHVDAYWEVLGRPLQAESVQSVSYWYSMWSHRRDGMWKGFVQVELDPSEDVVAVQVLAQAKSELGVEP
ncbi:Uncharacterised protein [Achromobacter spanius]|jgi:hypothetical protein|uniref:Nucleotidyltransferase family protein n=1 Tax=Achromobacter spanius TaxID=217203 RepID=A0AAW3HZJ5_9BURK|nr:MULTISPECIES: hypothetical protein [Achromobacter]SPT38480.1 Uncharacterised protein [Achromobacter denitrificans]AUA58299.1 hypothetical protein CVS48_21145 [Achromobacter spanius]KNE24625.1 hypothetical protein AFM18_24730 [Achromobacter spanius]MCD0501083.1 hypothetical protein [Achromobacter sp. MY14]MCW3154856.1 hypothetical protein [Achromobacter spanius]